MKHMLNNNSPNYQIVPIKAFEDNYIWCIHDGILAIIIDPGSYGKSVEFLLANKLTLAAILITHHHNDHIGGAMELAHSYNALLYSPSPELFIGYSPQQKVENGDIISIRLSQQLVSFNVMATPGHTLDHVVYYNRDMLFCGDTIFSGGCGRIFEGDYAMMYSSLRKIVNTLHSLNPNMLLYPAHEYTLNNLKFALSIDSYNKDLLNRYRDCLELRAQLRPTLPVNLKEELITNLFLSPQLLSSFALASLALDKSADEITIFTKLRQLRNVFQVDYTPRNNNNTKKHAKHMLNLNTT